MLFRSPGSVEANSVEESRYERGVYLVEMDAAGISAQLKQDYRQRPIVRLSLTARGQENLEELWQAAIAEVQTAIDSGDLVPVQQPIVELRIQGQVGFDRLELNVRQLQQALHQLSGALIFLLKYEVDTLEYISPLTEEASLQAIEQEIFADLLAANNQYKPRTAELAQRLSELKTRQLEGQPEVELYQFVQQLLQTS